MTNSNTEGKNRAGAVPDVEPRSAVPGPPDDPAAAVDVLESGEGSGLGAITPETDTTAAELTRQIAAEIVSAGPPGKRTWDAVFALTTAAETMEIVFADDTSSVSVAPPESVTALVRWHRELSARWEHGPWWRLLLWSDEGGEPEVGYDFGAEPFPEGQLFAPEVYRADLEVYPRSGLPVWLGAYIGHGGRQMRTPRQAVTASRADRDGGARPVVMTNELPDLGALWARWAVLSAAFVAVGSDRGPRILPSLGWFESPRRNGSTLYLLPGGRAVLSGGVWNSPALAAVYNNGTEMPDFYAGAPDWVADPVLNTRTGAGLLSFCYWWDRGRWYRSDSPPADQSAAAIPGIWTTDTVAGIITSLVPDPPGKSIRAVVDSLVVAAQAGGVTRELLAEVFEDATRVDIDGALAQFSLAGSVTEVGRQGLSAGDAVEGVRAYILGRGWDTTGYPLSRLTAERVEVGWRVWVPVSAGEIALDRAVFYIADDGVVERSSTAVAA
ncbi:hypothetical protein ABZV91_29065, partial [Nocardia sp. NPDC004568]|uniref:hypothetical protein n=1 Tax=Nocardia sp. NPDC004568 TaxID=3154551 RepID=UPI0033BEC976